MRKRGERERQKEEERKKRDKKREVRQNALFDASVLSLAVLTCSEASAASRYRESAEGSSRMRASTQREEERRGARDRDRKDDDEEEEEENKKNSKALNLSDDLERQVLLAAALTAALSRSRDVGLDLILGHRARVCLRERGCREKKENGNALGRKEK